LEVGEGGVEGGREGVVELEEGEESLGAERVEEEVEVVDVGGELF